MNLANPAALVLAALAIPIIVFYVLKIRLRRVPVSTVIFWQQIFEEKQPRSIWQHLRHLLSLLIQLLFLILLVLALGEPYFNWEVLEARRLVLVVDNSASMNASDVAPAARLIAILRESTDEEFQSAPLLERQVQVHCGICAGHCRSFQRFPSLLPHAQYGPAYRNPKACRQ